MAQASFGVPERGAVDTGAEVVIAGVMGLLIGSFLTVVAYRVPAGLSIVSPRSHCPVCGIPIRPIGNVPVLSYFLQRGRCANCGARISPRYPLIELATAGLFAGIAAERRGAWSVAAFCVLAAALVVLSVIDLEHLRLPTPIIAVAAFVGLPLLTIAAVVADDYGTLLRALVCAAAGAAIFLALRQIERGGVGLGDVRLAALCGAFLGWLGYGVAALGLFAAVIIGGLVAITLLSAGRVTPKTKLPFGPFLAAGTLIGVLAGPQLVPLWLHGA